jgi:hypothetical protein
VAGIRKAKEIVTERVTVTYSEKVKIDPPVLLKCDDRIKKWSWENAYMLVFLSGALIGYIVITWLVSLVTNFV